MADLFLSDRGHVLNAADVTANDPTRNTARKQEITVAKVAAQVAGALSIEFAGTFDDVVADQMLAAAVLADLAGADAPPSGVAPGGRVPLKVEMPSDWSHENGRCQALAAEHLSGDPDTLKSQREALAYQASGGLVTSWSDVTRGEFSQIRSWLEFIAGGHGRLVESDAPLHFGWQVVIEEAA